MKEFEDIDMRQEIHDLLKNNKLCNGSVKCSITEMLFCRLYFCYSSIVFSIEDFNPWKQRSE